VTGATTNSYNATSKILTITKLNPSNTVVTVYFFCTVSLSFSPTNPLLNDVVTFTLNITFYDGTPVSTFTANITKDSSPFKTNWNTTTFTDTEANIQSHDYNVSALSVDGVETTSYETSPVHVAWTGSSGPTGPTEPTPPPSETPAPSETPTPTEQPWTLPKAPFSIQDVIVFVTIFLIAVLIVTAIAQRKPKARKIKKFEGPSLKKIPRY